MLGNRSWISVPVLNNVPLRPFVWEIRSSSTWGGFQKSDSSTCLSILFYNSFVIVYDNESNCCEGKRLPVKSPYTRSRRSVWTPFHTTLKDRFSKEELFLFCPSLLSTNQTSGAKNGKPTLRTDFILTVYEGPYLSILLVSPLVVSTNIITQRLRWNIEGCIPGEWFTHVYLQT